MYSYHKVLQWIKVYWTIGTWLEEKEWVISFLDVKLCFSSWMAGCATCLPTILVLFSCLAGSKHFIVTFWASVEPVITLSCNLETWLFRYSFWLSWAKDESELGDRSSWDSGARCCWDCFPEMSLSSVWQYCCILRPANSSNIYRSLSGPFAALMLLNLTSNGMDKAKKTEDKHSKAAAALGELLIPQNITRSAFLPLNLGF